MYNEHRDFCSVFTGEENLLLLKFATIEVLHGNLSKYLQHKETRVVEFYLRRPFASGSLSQPDMTTS